MVYDKAEIKTDFFSWIRYLSKYERPECLNYNEWLLFRNLTYSGIIKDFKYRKSDEDKRVIDKAFKYYNHFHSSRKLNSACIPCYYKVDAFIRIVLMEQLCKETQDVINLYKGEFD